MSIYTVEFAIIKRHSGFHKSPVKSYCFCMERRSGSQVLPQTLQPQKAARVSLWLPSSVQANPIDRGEKHTCCSTLGQRQDTDGLPGLRLRLGKETNDHTVQQPVQISRDRGLRASNLRKAMRRKIAHPIPTSLQQTYSPACTTGQTSKPNQISKKSHLSMCCTCSHTRWICAALMPNLWNR